MARGIDSRKLITVMILAVVGSLFLPRPGGWLWGLWVADMSIFTVLVLWIMLRKAIKYLPVRRNE